MLRYEFKADEWRYGTDVGVEVRHKKLEYTST